VFRAALEQAEQLFRAAATVDYSARPILTYYGLAQASLAVIQASPRVTNKDCTPSSHGMRLDTDGTGLGRVVEEPAAKGVLALTAKATDSGGIGSNATFGRLWSTLPEMSRDLARRTDSALYPWYIGQPSAVSGEMHFTVNEDSLLKDDFDATLAAMLRARPLLAELDLRDGRPGTNWYTRNNSSNGFVIYFRGADPERVRRFISFNGTYYDSRTPHLYAVLDNAKSVHPLVVWLAILFGLSMFARYHPERWVELLNVDGSADAPMLEDILQRASIVCPGLILNTLDHMGVWCRMGIRP
jgi:hypothetical protein